jgi:hypothetical protein
LSANPHARLAELYRELASIHEHLSREGGEDYVDQRHSPLGARLHCRLARTGELPGYRAGRRVLIQRAHIEAYLERHRVTPTEPALGTQDDDDDLLAAIGGGRAA